MGLKQYDVGRSISHKNGEGSWQDTPIKALYTVGFHDVFGPLKVIITNTRCLRLSQIFHDLERPDQPVSKHGRGARGRELAQLGAHDVCVAPPRVHLDKVEAHDATGAWVRTREALVDLSEVPRLTRLSLDFSILKWTLQNGPKRARQPASCDAAKLETARKWNGLAHEIITLPPGVE